MRPVGILISSALLCGAHAATAVTTVTTATLAGPYGAPEHFYAGATASPYRFDAGDTVDLTLTFAGGAALAVPFVPSRLDIVLYTGEGILNARYTTSGTIDFLGAVGPVATHGGPATEVADGFPELSFSGFRLDTHGTFAFTGIHAVLHLDDAVKIFPIGDPVPSQIFRYAEIGLASDVPEPASWTLLVTGFGLVGLVARRPRRRIAA